jgi:AcrR family transcriptional regulator
MSKPKDHTKIQAITKATLLLVLETGITGVKMADIAKQSSMATGTLYIYFKNKEELVNQIYIDLKIEEMNFMLDKDRKEDSFFVRFKRIWLNYLKFNYEFPEKMIFFEQFYRSVYISEAIRQQSDILLQPIINILEDAKQQHIIKNLQANALIAQLTGSVKELVKLHLANKEKLTHELIDAYFDMAWNSIRR